jgi:acyl carrier protein
MGVSREEISSKLKVIIAEVTGFEPEEVSDDNSLSEDIGVESFDIVDINFRIEEEFGVKMGEQTFWNLKDMFENPELIDENNKLTLKGIQEMKRRIPNLDVSNDIEKTGAINFVEMLAEVRVKNLIDFIEMNQE